MPSWQRHAQKGVMHVHSSCFANLNLLGRLFKRYLTWGLVTWRWGTPGRWGNPLRWGNPPVHICSRLHDRWGDPPHVTSPTRGPPAPCKQALRPRVRKSLDLYISSLVGNFKKISAFLVYALCFHETFHDEWCFKDKRIGRPENVKNWLNSV